MNCKTVLLKDLVLGEKGSYGIGAPAVDYDPKKYTYLRITDINDDGSINTNGLKSVDAEDAYKYILQENDIVFARTGASTGKTYFYQPQDGTLVYAGFLIKFSIDPQKVNPRLLKYITHSQEYYNWVRSFDTGGTRGNINAVTFANMPITLPDRATQDKIVAILSSLDDKIELNRRINANLEQQAQALYKSWFVDFEPFGGKMPEDWREGTLGEICTCYLGGTPSRTQSEYWSGNIPWINSGEVNKFRIIEGSEFITELGLKKSATKLLPKKTTVLAITGATLGQVSLLEIDSCANQSVIGILENKCIPYEFIYPLIKNDIDKIIRHQTGGAQQHINKNNIESHSVIIPDTKTMEQYKAIQAPVYNLIANKCFENLRLAQLRDTLLPKLMSGEITV